MTTKRTPASARPAHKPAAKKPASRTRVAPPKLGEGIVEVSGVFGRVRYSENDPNAEIREIFDHYDRDKNGEIDAREFARVCEALGMEMEEHELKIALLDVDRDGDEKISWVDFLSWWRSMRG